MLTPLYGLTLIHLSLTYDPGDHIDHPALLAGPVRGRATTSICRQMLILNKPGRTTFTLDISLIRAVQTKRTLFVHGITSNDIYLTSFRTTLVCTRQDKQSQSEYQVFVANQLICSFPFFLRAASLIKRLLLLIFFQLHVKKQ